MTRPMTAEECMAWPEQTYRIEEDPGERPCIRFFPCGLVSYHSQDVQYRFCARCHTFFDKDGKAEHRETIP